ncbi:hypothetical protein [uncultured Arsenicicoccus sp.]|uniref:hypothetical protein n=1 Tax=uncultured Arsenicicoccus sp. TaxID=491339 RepID=UPI0025936962|nr:hypothetical protein [uncultured Arsenicicoccus sp.]
MALTTRPPTGLPTWPITLIAGSPKAGKSYAAASAAGSDLITRTLWVPVGEDDPDELAPLGPFDIVQHDGTYRGILYAISDAVDHLAEQPGVGLLIVDSLGKLWDIIKNDLQAVANQRLKVKGRGRTNDNGEAQITMDLWNLGRSRWDNVMDELRRHQGPSIVTARMNYATIMDDNGQPTKHKDWTIEGHKTLPYDVGAVVKMPARGEVYLTGVRSLRMGIDASETVKADGWSMHVMWERMGLGEDAGQRTHQGRTLPLDGSGTRQDAQEAAQDAGTPAEAPGDPEPQNAPQEPAQYPWTIVLAGALAADDPEGVKSKYRHAQFADALGVVVDGALTDAHRAALGIPDGYQGVTLGPVLVAIVNRLEAGNGPVVTP